MHNGYYSATGGMVTQFGRLDNIANNLANLNTNGYKKTDVVIGDFLRLYQEKREELPLENHTVEGSKFIHRSITRVPHIVESYTDYKTASMQQTDNRFDAAINEDNMFFAVNTPDGVRLTRNGSFMLNQDGILTTKEGYEVLPADYKQSGSFIKFTDEERPTLDKDGIFYIDGAPFKQLLLVRPQNVKNLVKEGDSLLKADPADPLTPVTNSNSILKGFVEKSNVNAVTEMTAMIETHRLVEMYQKAMDSQMNDLNRDAVTRLANVRA